MELLSICNLKPFRISFPHQIHTVHRSISSFSPPLRNLSNKPCLLRARKKKSEPDPVLEPTIIFVDDDESDVEEDELLLDDSDDEALFIDDDDDEDGDEDFEDDDDEPYSGDGAGGGGISLAGMPWDKEALALAEEVIQSFDGDLGIYAFKTLRNSSIKVRIEKLSNRYGAPTMADIEAFSIAYRARLDKAEIAKTVPDNLYFEVSSPGLERAVRIPGDLERFKERTMYVRYVNEDDSSKESDGVLRLVSYDMDLESCTWGLADVKINRAKAGKGRPLSKKQREWRLTTPFDSLRLVRLHVEV